MLCSLRKPSRKAKFVKKSFMTQSWFKGIHAREWIAPAMATYLMRELIEKDTTGYIDHLNFHILPSANPDGYEFTRDNDRFWRKTRSRGSSGSSCMGADGNRNFDIEFGGEFLITNRLCVSLTLLDISHMASFLPHPT